MKEEGAIVSEVAQLIVITSRQLCDTVKPLHSFVGRLGRLASQ